MPQTNDSVWTNLLGGNTTSQLNQCNCRIQLLVDLKLKSYLKFIRLWQSCNEKTFCNIALYSAITLLKKLGQLQNPSTCWSAILSGSIQPIPIVQNNHPEMDRIDGHLVVELWSYLNLNQKNYLFMSLCPGTPLRILHIFAWFQVGSVTHKLISTSFEECIQPGAYFFATVMSQMIQTP